MCVGGVREGESSYLMNKRSVKKLFHIHSFSNEKKQK